jgi:ribosome biogenesis GTPase
LPGVGDWVCISLRAQERRATIHRLLERRTKISRKSAGTATDEQVLAANVDNLLLVSSLNRELNPKRIERYLALARESGTRPALLLTKADLCGDVAGTVAEVNKLAQSVPVHVLSAFEGRGLDALDTYLGLGQTSVLLGSSGVGKSTLVNALIGEKRQSVREIRSRDDRGRHATTARRLFFVPRGGMIIDTPGIRALQLWSVDEGFDKIFWDVEAAAAGCLFASCTHRDGTPGCRVQSGIKSGAFTDDHVENWLKVGLEIRSLTRKQKQKAQSEEKKRLRAFALADKQRYDPEVEL